MIPRSRPQMTRNQVMGLLAKAGLDKQLTEADTLLIVGVRGYYRDTMGAPGRNDRGLYDDAIFIVTPDRFHAFNANTDASRVRRGSGKGAAKGMAMLKPGLWRAHQIGTHRAGTKSAHQALVQQNGPVTVRRDGSPDYDDAGYFGINIHRGGNGTTSSLGCQTIPPGQWAEFIGKVIECAKRRFGASWAEGTIPYALIDNSQ